MSSFSGCRHHLRFLSRSSEEVGECDQDDRGGADEKHYATDEIAISLDMTFEILRIGRVGLLLNFSALDALFFKHV